MKPSFKHILGALAVVLAAPAGAHAEYIVEQSGCLSSMGCGQPARPCYGYAYNPPTFMADCCGWTAGIDFLYLKYRQDCISFGREVRLESYENDSANAAIFKGAGYSTDKFVEQQWNAGFRLALGYKGACDCWDLNLVFTHFNPDDVSTRVATQFTEGTTVSAGTVFIPTFSAFSSIVDISFLPDAFSRFTAEADLHFRFNQLDLDMSRDFFVGRCVTMKPVFGLRALFVDEKYNIVYEAETASGAATAIDYREDVKMENEFKGVGLKAGLESTYSIGCGLAFYGSATGAIAYGEYEVDQRNSLFVTTTVGTNTADTGTFQLHHADQYNTLVSAADLGLGLTWTQLFNCDKSAFNVKIGYEHHVVYDFNQFRSITILDDLGNASAACASGDLALYGIVVGANVAF